MLSLPCLCLPSPTCPRGTPEPPLRPGTHSAQCSPLLGHRGDCTGSSPPPPAPGWLLRFLPASPSCTELSAQDLGSQQGKVYLAERVLDPFFHNIPMSLVLCGGSKDSRCLKGSSFHMGGPLPIGHKLQDLYEELPQAFPPHLAFQLHFVAG